MKAFFMNGPLASLMSSLPVCKHEGSNSLKKTLIKVVHAGLLWNFEESGGDSGPLSQSKRKNHEEKEQKKSKWNERITIFLSLSCYIVPEGAALLLLSGCKNDLW